MGFRRWKFQFTLLLRKLSNDQYERMHASPTVRDGVNIFKYVIKCLRTYLYEFG
jgi:hypothetical protein